MTSNPIEHIIRPIVEGQLRGFLKEHPSILDCVLWFKPRSDKAETFVGSLAKRIVLDLTSGTTTGRLRAALLVGKSGDAANPEAAAHHSAATDGGSGTSTGPSVPQIEELEERLAAAYQIIGVLLDNLGMHDSIRGQELLDYFAGYENAKNPLPFSMQKLLNTNPQGE